MKKVVICLLAALSMLLTGCGIHINIDFNGDELKEKLKNLEDLNESVFNYKYDDASRYSVGNGQVAAKDVRQICIDWVSGDVEVALCDCEDISFEETTGSSLDDGLRVHYWLDGDVLRLRFASSGKWKIGNLHKDLKVFVPRQLEKLEIETISANVTISGGVADEIEVESVSGQITAGDLYQVSRWESRTVSGSVDLSCTTMLRSIDMESVSGDVVLTLPADAEFTAEVDSASGSFTCDFAATKNGTTYVCGKGGAEIEMETVSGNIMLLSSAGGMQGTTI